MTIMSKKTIGEATSFIEELLALMEDMYWETNAVDVKDQCFNVIRLLQNEMTELTKISVQDHDYEYEVIVCKPGQMKASIDELEDILAGEVLRQRTREHLVPLLETAKIVFA